MILLKLFWMLTGVQLKRPFDQIMEHHRISEDDYKDIVDALDSNCQTLADEIDQRVKALRASKKTGKAAGEAASPSKSASPSKPALRETSSVRSLSPFKTPAHKRKVTFSPVKDFEVESNSGVEDTPSKRQKFSSPNKYNKSPAFTAFQQAARGQSSMASAVSTPSSSRTTLDLLQGRASEDEVIQGATSVAESEDAELQIPPLSDASSSDVDSNVPDVEMSDASTSSAAPSSPEPTTPRRSQRQGKPRFPSLAMTPTTSSVDGTPRKGALGKSSRRYDVNAEEPTRRRRRPVLLEHRQWQQRDPRVVREEKMREQWVKEMIEKRGSHPFERLRADIASG